ncbi:MAG: hypothetical protein WCC58_02095 [Burkholderiales bacterium]
MDNGQALRILAILSLFAAAVVFYALGSAPGAGSLLLLGVVFESLGWFKLIKAKRRD